MASADETLLRLYLGESVPDGGAESDTMFTSAQLVALLARAGGDLHRATAEGWSIKAAHYARLVDVSDGGDSRAMSQLHRQALSEHARWSGMVGAGGGTRIHRIQRPEV